MQDQTLSAGFPTENVGIAEAARWLSSHRGECVARIIPTLRERFGLSARDAIAAAQKAHALQYGGE